MQDIIKMVIFMMTTLTFTYIAIALAAKESKEYVLNVKETALVFFISIMFNVWLILAGWTAINWYALIVLNVIFSVLSMSFFIDAKLQELPDRITIIVLICAILLLAQPAVWANGLTNISSRFFFATCVTAASFFFSVKTENLGMGDVKLLFPLCLLVGINKAMPYLYNVLIPAFVISVIYLAIKRKKDMKIAFGPFLIIGFVLTFSILPISVLAFL